MGISIFDLIALSAMHPIGNNYKFQNRTRHTTDFPSVQRKEPSKKHRRWSKKKTQQNRVVKKSRKKNRKKKS